MRDSQFSITFNDLFRKYTSDKISSSNIYKHKSDMKKKILNNSPSIRDNGRVDYELILFRRVLELELALNN